MRANSTPLLPQGTCGASARRHSTWTTRTRHRRTLPILLLALLMGTLLPSVASAATYYGFKLGNVKVTSDNCGNISGTYIIKKYGDSSQAFYDPATNTLTLRNLTVDVGSKDCYAIQNESCNGLKIIVQNVYFVCQKRACGRFDANTTISSDALNYVVSFQCTGQEGITISNGAKLTIDNATMMVSSEKDNPMNGINGKESLVLKNGTQLNVSSAATGKTIKNIATLEVYDSFIRDDGSSAISGDGTSGNALTAGFTNVRISDGDKSSFLATTLKMLKRMPDLKSLDCHSNNLTTIDLSANTKLEELTIYDNNINGIDASVFISKLPTVTAYKTLYFHSGSKTEQNLLTESQVDACKAKGWLPQFRKGNSAWSSCVGAKTAAVVSDGKEQVSIKKMEGGLIAGGVVFYPWPENSSSKPSWHTTEVLSSCTYIGIEQSVDGEATSYINNVFSGLGNLVTIAGLEYLDTSNETDMSNMFKGCSSLKSVNVSELNTSKVTTMEGMFDQCKSLTDLDLSGFDTKNVTTMANMFRYCTSLTSVDVSSFDTKNVTTMEAMFRDCSSLASIDVSSFDTQNVTNMNAMFNDCSSLASLDISNFTIGSGTGVTFMFDGDKSLKTLNVGSNVFSAGNYTTFRSVGQWSDPCTLYYSKGFDKSVLGEKQSGGYYKWYSGYFTLANEIPVAILSTNSDGATKTLTFTKGIIDDVTATGGADGTYQLNTGSASPGWYKYGDDASVTKVTKVVFKSDFADVRPTSMHYWFYNMKKLTAIEGMASYLNTSEVTNMSYLFDNCSSLTSVDLSNFNTSEVTDMTSMFENCTSLTSIDLSKFNTAKVKNMMNMFSGCSSLTSLDVSKFDTGNVTEMTNMFVNCSSLTSLDLSNFNTENVRSMTGMFSLCTALTDINLSNFNTEKVDNTIWMFVGCGALKNLYLGGNDFKAVADKYKQGMFRGVGTSSNPCNLYFDQYFDTAVLGDLGIAIRDSALQWINGYFKIGLVPGVKILKEDDDLAMTFTYICDGGDKYTTARNAGEGQYGMGNVSSTAYTPDWSGKAGDVTRVRFAEDFTSNYTPTKTRGWFLSMSKLETIENLPDLNTSEVTDMTYMFRGCSALEYIDLSNFNTSKVTGMAALFRGCSSLHDLDVSGFNTSAAKTFTSLFADCTGLTSLDLSGFDFSSATSVRALLYGCTALTELTLGKNSNINSVGNTTSTFYGVGTESNPCQLNIEDGFDRTVLGEEQSGGYYQWLEGYFTVYQEPTVPVAVLADNSDGPRTLTFTYAKLSDATAEDGATGTYLLNDEDETPGWTKANNTVSKVVFNDDFANARPTSTYYWFGCDDGTSSIATIEGIENLNTSEVTTMAHMFSSCLSLESLDVSGFNTSKVTSFDHMFIETRMASLDLSGFDTQNATSMRFMFANTGLTALDISHFVISDDTDVSYFADSSNKLASLNVGSNDFSTNTSVTASPYLFGGVGTADNPCELTFTAGFASKVLGGKQTGNYYKWLNGYFKLSPTTDIDNIGMDDGDNDMPRYNLGGQRVGRSYRGIVIKNGKKELRIRN